MELEIRALSSLGMRKLAWSCQWHGFGAVKKPIGSGENETPPVAEEERNGGERQSSLAYVPALFGYGSR